MRTQFWRKTLQAGSYVWLQGLASRSLAAGCNSTYFSLSGFVLWACRPVGSLTGNMSVSDQSWAGVESPNCRTRICKTKPMTRLPAKFRKASVCHRLPGHACRSPTVPVALLNTYASHACGFLCTRGCKRILPLFTQCRESASVATVRKVWMNSWILCQKRKLLLRLHKKLKSPLSQPKFFHAIILHRKHPFCVCMFVHVGVCPSAHLLVAVPRMLSSVQTGTSATARARARGGLCAFVCLGHAVSPQTEVFSLPSTLQQH